MRPAVALRSSPRLPVLLLTALAAGSLGLSPSASARAADPDADREVVRQFALEHVELPAAMILLRTMADSRRLVPNDPLDAIVVRDTPARIELAARLIELYDRPAAEVEVDVDRLTVDAATLTELAQGAGEGSAVRVPANRLADLAAGGVHRLTTLSAISGDSARYEADGGHRPADLAPADLEISVQPRVHGETGEIGLDVAAEAVHRGEHGTGVRKLTSSLRLDAGSAFLLVGLLPEGADGPGRVPVVALTPRIVRPSGLRPADLEAVAAVTDLRRTPGGPVPAATDARP